VASGEDGIRVWVHGSSHAGRLRHDNQDSFLVASVGEGGDGFAPLGSDTAAVEIPSLRGFVLGQRGMLAIVADGMGGAAAGAVASQLAVLEVYRRVTAGWPAEPDRAPDHFASVLREAVEEAGARIYEQALADPECHGMGTTLTAVGVIEGRLHVAHVGDSRAYLVRGGEALQLTRDQSLVQQLVDSGALTPEEANRSPHANILLQALGVEPTVRVDLACRELRRGDTVVLCSDGLFRMVPAEEVAEVVGGIEDPVPLCELLVDLANHRGGPDNITVVVARFGGTGLAPPEATG